MKRLIIIPLLVFLVGCGNNREKEIEKLTANLKINDNYVCTDKICSMEEKSNTSSNTISINFNSRVFTQYQKYSLSESDSTVYESRYNYKENTIHYVSNVNGDVITINIDKNNNVTCSINNQKECKNIEDKAKVSIETFKTILKNNNSSIDKIK